MVDTITRMMAFLAVACIVFMAVATIGDVVWREASGESIAGVQELGEVAMVVIVYLSLGYAQTRRAHPAMTLLVDRLRPRAAMLLNSAGLILVIGIVVWMAIVTGERAVHSAAQGEYRFGLVQIPVWPARIVIVVGLVAFLLELVFMLSDNIREFRLASAESVDTPERA